MTPRKPESELKRKRKAPAGEGSPGAISVLRQVNVNRGEKELSYYDKEGVKRPLGRVMADNFQNEGIQKFSFLPDPSNPFATAKKDGAAFNLGVASDKFQAVNPADAQEILGEKGFVLQDIFGVYGGTELTFVYNNPNSRLEDAIGYDVETWGMIRHGEDRVGDRPYVNHTIKLNVSMVIGKIGARFSSGIWRYVCTNLAVSQVLGLPTVEFRHNQWNPKRAQELMNGDGFNGLEEVPMGPQIGTARTLGAAHEVLMDYHSEVRANDFSGRFDYLQSEFTPFRKDYMSPAILENYIQHLGLLVNAKAEEDRNAPVFALELVNAYTSAISQKRIRQNTDRGTWVAYNQVDPVVKSTTRLAQMAGLFSAN